MIRKLLKKLLIWALKDEPTQTKTNADASIWDGKEPEIDRKLFVYSGDAVVGMTAKRVENDSIGIICDDGQGKERIVMPWDAYSQKSFSKIWRSLGGKPSYLTWDDGSPYGE